MTRHRRELFLRLCGRDARVFSPATQLGLALAPIEQRRALAARPADGRSL
jgi:hypothetical protein